jgi:hypothetical protein
LEQSARKKRKTSRARLVFERFFWEGVSRAQGFMAMLGWIAILTCSASSSTYRKDRRFAGKASYP